MLQNLSKFVIFNNIYTNIIKKVGDIQMKAIGIVRKLDSVGRYVLPTELRRSLKIKIGDPLEIFVEEDRIILKKYEPSCIFCGEANGIINCKGKNICIRCMQELRK